MSDPCGFQLLGNFHRYGIAQPHASLSRIPETSSDMQKALCDSLLPYPTSPATPNGSFPDNPTDLDSDSDMFIFVADTD